MDGLTVDQAHRLLEDFQTLVMVSQQQLNCAKLNQQVIEGIGRDIRGMLNGNCKEADNGNDTSVGTGS